jgi:hypothetical protein
MWTGTTKSVPTRFLAPIDRYKILAQISYAGGIDSVELMLGVFKSLQKLVKMDRCWWKKERFEIQKPVFVFRPIGCYIFPNI